jgi:F-type H+-transporting ATPase subunit alpha
LIVYAGVNGFLDSYPVAVLQRYEQELYKFVEDKHADVLAEIEKKKQLDEALDQKVRKILEGFKQVFVP